MITLDEILKTVLDLAEDQLSQATGNTKTFYINDTNHLNFKKHRLETVQTLSSLLSELSYNTQATPEEKEKILNSFYELVNRIEPEIKKLIDEK